MLAPPARGQQEARRQSLRHVGRRQPHRGRGQSQSIGLTYLAGIPLYSHLSPNKIPLLNTPLRACVTLPNILSLPYILSSQRIHEDKTMNINLPIIAGTISTIIFYRKNTLHFPNASAALTFSSVLCKYRLPILKSGRICRGT